MAKQRYARFLSRRSIVSLIGIDYSILEKTGNDNINKFYFSGFLVIVILIISFASVFYAFDLMFHMWHAEILLSSFFSLMFFNTYIFLIQTFSKEVFPTAYKLKFLNLSNISRIGFVLLIGFLIAQPVKIFIVRHQLDKDIVSYKKQLYQDFCKVSAELYRNDLDKLNTNKIYYSSFTQNTISDVQLTEIDKQISSIQKSISVANKQAFLEISKSDFFTKRIELASKYTLANVAVIVVLIIFCGPIALIYSISGNSKYYELKKAYDKDLEVKRYKQFKNQYSLVFSNKYGFNSVHYHEPYLDPPFNTKRIPEPQFLSQDDFINKFLNQ